LNATVNSILIDKLIFYVIIVAIVSTMVTPINGKPVRKPRNVKINPDTLLKARVEALRSKKTLGQWLQ